MIVVKRLGGGGHVQQALVSFSLGNGPLCPETKLTHTHTLLLFIPLLALTYRQTDGDSNTLT
jgi:hypothetical protein